jgi:uncharacterized protein (DUF433 family)/transcriptional regulator with XRE-family HTH domain
VIPNIHWTFQSGGGHIRAEDIKVQTPESWIELGRRGAFTTSQVARLIGTEPETIASWLAGRPPLIASNLPQVAGRLAVSFDGLVEARAVSYLLREGIPRRKLARAMAAMRNRWGDPHPLARERSIMTDGASVLEIDGDRIVDLLNDAYVMSEALKPGLSGRVVFKSGRAAWLEPFPKDLPLVRIEPARAFGRPVIVEGKVSVPTSTLADSAKLEGREEAADWFGVSEEAVGQAVEFEHRLAA